MFYVFYISLAKGWLYISDCLMAQNDLLSEAELVEAHKLAVHQLATSQRVAIAVPLLLLVGLIVALWIQLDQFRKVGASQTIGLLVEHAPQSLSPVALEAAKSVERLAPVYADAISQMAARDQAKINAIADAQIKEFKTYAQTTQVTIASNLKKMVEQSAAKVSDRLTAGMTSDQAARFHEEVASAIYAKTGEQLQARWYDQLNLVGKVCADLYSIALSTPEAKETAPSVVLGAGMELMGRKIQGIK